MGVSMMQPLTEDQYAKKKFRAYQASLSYPEKGAPSGRDAEATRTYLREARDYDQAMAS